MKLTRSNMQLWKTMGLILFYFLFDMTQGDPQLVHVIPVENPTYYAEYRCVTEPEVENTKYSWRRQDWSGLPEGVKAEGDRLHFLKLSPELDGIYICEAVNKNGAAAGSVFRWQKQNHSEL
ncbi:hypothetical protein AMELA_G00088880 [Ameiurus melas]|uniref:Ig-like domain-containing protein n=1 Tax=Ameiurus melas TaxID=219545 RepID=A0A7J6AZ33_AMEME|nr:hypothetical protein AMELA_G00088880 [Ameiurus melas]